MATTQKFSEGDRVKPWGKSKDVGTVDDVWHDAVGNEVVAVVWDRSGCVGEMRAHQLQFVAPAN